MAKKATTTPTPAAKAKAAPAKPAAAAKTAAPARPAAKASPAKSAAPAKAPAPATITLKQMAVDFAEKHDMAKKDADTMLNDVFGAVIEHLKSGDRVRIGGLGIIEVKDRPARMGRNPATGEAIEIKASRKIAFRAAKELKEAI